MTPTLRSIGASTCVAILALLTAQGAVAQWDVLVKVDGAIGQNSVSAFGTGQLVTTGNELTIPGLTITTNAPTNSVTIVSTDGGVTFNNAASGAAQVDIKILIDGATLRNGGYQRVYVGGPPGAPFQAYSHWSMQVSLELKPGSHTIEVQARKVNAASATAQAVIVGGDAASGVQGSLTVTTLQR